MPASVEWNERLPIRWKSASGQGQAPSFVQTTLAQGEVGSTAATNLLVVGNTPMTFAIVSGAIPPGRTINAATGSMTGTFSRAGTFSWRLLVSNEFGSVEQALSQQVTAPLSITTTTLADATVGVSYQQTLAAAGSTPITWSVTSGALPGGITLSAAGVLAGTPTAAGVATFTVQASNGSVATRSLTLRVVAAPRVIWTKRRTRGNNTAWSVR